MLGSDFKVSTEPGGIRRQEEITVELVLDRGAERHEFNSPQGRIQDGEDVGDYGSERLQELGTRDTGYSKCIEAEILLVNGATWPSITSVVIQTRVCPPGNRGRSARASVERMRVRKATRTGRFANDSLQRGEKTG
jgi:hypothetical protein